MGDGVTLRVLGHTSLDPTCHLTSMQRTILAALALRAPQPMTADTLIPLVWGPTPPRSARAALQNQISRLRSLLPEPALTSEDGGYQWEADVDVQLAQQAVLIAESMLRRKAASAFRITDEPLAQISGEPYLDLPETPEVRRARRHARSVVISLENLRLRAGLADQMTDWAVAEAERLTLEQPHDERRCIWHARALEASGRRGDALAAISRFRRRLRNDLGLGATDLLTEAEQAILADEATLERTPRRGAPIGRQEAVGALLADIRRDRNVVVSGEPGIGVTSVLSLLHTAATRAGMAVARAQCPRGPEPVALVLLEELMADLGTQPTRSWSVLSEFVRALEQRSARDAVLLIVDDVDAAGPTTLRALAEVGSFHGVHLALGTHATAAELHPIDAVEHPLGPLNTHDITRIMVETGAQPGDDEVAAFQTATAGNPLLLHTLLQQESQRLDLAAPPQQLATVVRARLSHLSPRSRDALVWIAAADASLPLDVLIEACPAVELVSEEDAWLIDPATMTFRHGAIRDLVRLEVSHERRAEIHHTLATLARAHGLSPVVVMHHALHAASLDLEGALSAAQDAAADAVRRGAHAEAASCLSSALDLLRDAPAEQQLDLRVAHGDALRLAGDHRYIAVLQDAAREALAQDLPRQLASAMFALMQLGATSATGSVDPRTIELAEAAFTRLQDSEERAVVGAAASMSLALAGRAQRALEIFRHSEQLATNPKTRSVVLPFAYLPLGHPDHRHESARLSAELIVLAEADGNPATRWKGHYLRFSTAALAGDGNAMRDSHAVMESLMPQIGDVGRIWSFQGQAAALAHLEGDYDGAEALALEAYHHFVSVSESRAVSALQSQVLGIHLSRGTTSELIDSLMDLVAAQPFLPAWRAALGHALASVGSATAKEHLLFTLKHNQRDFTWLAAHVVGARGTALLGDARLARVYLEALAPYSDLACWQGTCSYGPVATALAQVAAITGDDRGEAWARQAVEVAHRLASPSFAKEAKNLSDWGLLASC